MTLLDIIIPPLLGSIIALSTNWLAIKMLFRPHRAKYIFGLRVPFTPGLIPKERNRLATKMAEAISTRLLTPEVLAAELADPAVWPLPDITIGEMLQNFGITDTASLTTPLAPRLKAVADKLLPQALAVIQNLENSQPELDKKLAELTYKVIDENIGTIASMFVSRGKIYASIKTNLFAYLSDEGNYEPLREKIHEGIDALLTHPEMHKVITEKFLAFNIKNDLGEFFAKEKHAVSGVLTAVASYIAKHMPIQTMIENKLASFDVAEAENVILSVAGRELRLIIWLGGILGFVIGTLSLFF